MSGPGPLSREAIRDAVRDWIVGTFLKGARSTSVHDGTTLLGGDLIDSIGMLELTVHLEDRFGITIAADDVSPENFGTLEALSRFVLARQKDAT